MITTDYDKDTPPQMDTVVTVSVLIEDIDDVSENDMTYRLWTYFSFEWWDRRLKVQSDLAKTVCLQAL